MKRLLVVVLVVALALGLVGCKKISEKVGEEVGEKIVGTATGTDVEVDGDEVTIKTDEGDVTMNSTEGELPKDFPDDFPMYDKAQVDSTSSWAGGSDTTFYVNLLSDDSAQEVYDWYKAELTDKGWTIASDTFMTGDSSGGLMSATKDKSTLTFTTSQENEGCSVGIILVITK